MVDCLGIVIMRLRGPTLVVRAGSPWLAAAIDMIDINSPVLEKERQICVLIYHITQTCIQRRSEQQHMTAPIHISLVTSNRCLWYVPLNSLGSRAKHNSVSTC